MNLLLKMRIFTFAEIAETPNVAIFIVAKTKAFLFVYMHNLQGTILYPITIIYVER